jgi:hypothetical protein
LEIDKMINKKRNKGMPASVFMSGGFNSHANALAGDFGAILDGWRKASLAGSEPKSYEAKGRKLTMTEAKLAVAEAKRQTPLALHGKFEAIVEEFDGGYDWDWRMRRPDSIKIGGWMTR